MVLLTPHIIGSSGVHGTGLFTTVPLLEGMEIWNFDPSLDKRRLLSTLDPCQRLKALHYGYINPRQPEWLVICGDDARYWNFPNPGEAPNARLSDRIRHGENVVVASRGIAAGEELLIEPCSDADYFRKMGRMISWSSTPDGELSGDLRWFGMNATPLRSSDEDDSFPCRSG
jgi:hypothetical protein